VIASRGIVNSADGPSNIKPGSFIGISGPKSGRARDSANHAAPAGARRLLSCVTFGTVKGN